MAYLAGTAGRFTVQNPSGLALTVTASLGTTAQTFYTNADRATGGATSQTIAAGTTSSTFYLASDGVYTISVRYLAREIANTPDGTRSIVANSDNATTFAVDIDPSALDALPLGIPLQSIAREDAVSNLTALTSGVMFDMPCWIPAGTVVTSIGSANATTAMTTPTNSWGAIYTPDGLTLLGQSATSTTTVAANTDNVQTLTTPVTIATSGFYRIATMTQGTVQTNWGTAVGNASVAAARGNQPRGASTSGSALTTTAPATIVTPTAVVNQILMWVA